MISQQLSHLRDESAHRALVSYSISLMCLIVLGLMSSQADARVGDWGDPIQITALPFTHTSDTAPRPTSRINQYGCASYLSESGPEVVYQLTVDDDGIISASLEGDNGVVDVDIHLLGSAQVSGDEATDCIARDNRSIEQSVSAGTYLITVDSYEGDAQAGPYTLRVNFEPEDAWYRRPVAQGVTLETRRYTSLFGGNQFGSVLRVDLNQPGVEVKPVQASGCQTTSQIASGAGAVAAVNAGFFGGGCGSVSLLKIDGRLISTNARSRSAFGVTAQGTPQISWVPSGQDWPAAYHAVGGLSRLASGGAVDVEWERDSADYSFTYGANPRTGVGISADGGEVTLATLDGRTAAGAGVSLFDFGQWLVWLSVSDALNLDGGGSTTLWTVTEGVVNFPSDNGYADHFGERGVANVLAVFAPPLSREAEWVVSGGRGSISVGETLTLEAFARDPDGGAVSFTARASGQGTLSLNDRGDGSCALSYTASRDDSSEVTITIEARARGALDGVWSTRVQVLGGTGSNGGESAGSEGGSEAGDSAGSTSGETAAGDGDPGGAEAGGSPSGGYDSGGYDSGGSDSGGSDSGGADSGGSMSGGGGSGSSMSGGGSGGSASGGSSSGGAGSTASGGSGTGGDTSDERYDPRVSMGRVMGQQGGGSEAGSDPIAPIAPAPSGVSCDAAHPHNHHVSVTRSLWLSLLLLSLFLWRRRALSLISPEALR